MNLTGGIQNYCLALDGQEKILSRYEDDKPPYGRKVRFLGRNGYGSESEDAKKYLETGKEYTVKEIWVHRSSSEVELIECPGRHWNTVMFEDVEGRI